MTATTPAKRIWCCNFADTVGKIWFTRSYGNFCDAVARIDYPSMSRHSDEKQKCMQIVSTVSRQTDDGFVVSLIRQLHFLDLVPASTAGVITEVKLIS
jgi:hypothetical protein